MFSHLFLIRRSGIIIPVYNWGNGLRGTKIQKSQNNGRTETLKKHKRTVIFPFKLPFSKILIKINY